MTLGEPAVDAGPRRPHQPRVVTLDASAVVEHLDLDDGGVVESCTSTVVDGVADRVERWSRPS